MVPPLNILHVIGQIQCNWYLHCIQKVKRYGITLPHSHSLIHPTTHKRLCYHILSSLLWRENKLENWHSQRGPRWGHVILTLTFDLLTPKSIGVFLSLSSICVWSMKSLGQTLFELSRYKESVDRRTDGRTDKVITIGLPHLDGGALTTNEPPIAKRALSVAVGQSRNDIIF